MPTLWKAALQRNLVWLHLGPSTASLEVSEVCFSHLLRTPSFVTCVSVRSHGLNRLHDNGPEMVVLPLSTASFSPYRTCTRCSRPCFSYSNLTSRAEAQEKGSTHSD